MSSRQLATALTTMALIVTACGSDDSAATVPGDGAPTVVATTSIWADIASNVACDGLARVESVIPLGGDPHSFEPSLRDRETMENAALVVANGLFLEESLVDTIDAVEQSGVPVLRVGDGLDTLPGGAHDDEQEEAATTSTEEAHDDDAHDGADEHGGADPHVWWDPTRVAAAVPAIADALSDVGVDRAALDACVTRYTDELATLDDEVLAIVAPLPVDQRILVTNHDSLEYFADRYDFQVLGSVIPSSSSLAATSPAELDALAAEIQATGVPAIFAETQSSSVDADALAGRIGDVAVVSILTGTLDEPGTPAGTYVGWLRQNVQTIVDALSDSEAS